MIRSVEVHQFRGILEGRLDGLTPLVVLVGPNGSGKSALLDALLIGASPNPADAVGRVVQRRAGVQRGARWLFHRADTAGTGCIKLVVGDQWRECLLHVDPADPGSQPVSVRIDVSEGSSAEPDGAPVTLGSLVAHIQPGNAYNASGPPTNAGAALDTRLLDAGAVELRTPLHEVYSRMVEQGRKEEARSIVAVLAPKAEGLEILTEGGVPVVHLVYPDHSVPVALAGDGTQAVLRLGLELAARPGGVVLLEEPEVHQHPAAIRQTARAIWTAVRRGIQVILTTHSLEMIDALVAEPSTDEETEKLTVYRVALEDGHLRTSRLPGPDVAFSRVQLEDDLR